MLFDELENGDIFKFQDKERQYIKTGINCFHDITELGIIFSPSHEYRYVGWNESTLDCYELVKLL